MLLKNIIINEIFMRKLKSKKPDDLSLEERALEHLPTEKRTKIFDFKDPEEFDKSLVPEGISVVDTIDIEDDFSSFNDKYNAAVFDSELLSRIKKFVVNESFQVLRDRGLYEKRVDAIKSFGLNPDIKTNRIINESDFISFEHEYLGNEIEDGDLNIVFTGIFQNDYKSDWNDFDLESLGASIAKRIEEYYDEESLEVKDISLTPTGNSKYKLKVHVIISSSIGQNYIAKLNSLQIFLSNSGFKKESILLKKFK